MKIIEKKLNLLDFDGPIAHGVNCQGVMNSGVAKAIRAKYPEVFLEYAALVKEWDESHADRLGLLGRIQHVVCSDGHDVFNLFTQHSYGYSTNRYMSYDALQTALSELDAFLPVATEVGLPLIGAGLGGGNWNIIKAIIEETMVRTQPVICRI